MDNKKIVLAIDSFKGSASSWAIGEYVRDGISKIIPDANFSIVPIADGGEGTVEAIVTARKGEFHKVSVRGPLGAITEATYGMIDGHVAVLEMAAASGITLVPKSELNPMKASTYGTGQMVLDAVSKGAKEIYMGIGGSATNDGGMGLACALGIKFLDGDGNELPPEAESLGKVVHIVTDHLDSRIKDVKFTILCDVDNPLCGPHGASHIFGKQKGADEAMRNVLDDYLRHYAEVIKNDLGIDIVDIPGAGAAGGLGAGMMAFAHAEKMRGIEAVMMLIRMEDQLLGADLVVTGEGRMDNQTAYGKAPVGVSSLATKQNIPVIAVVGGVALDTEDVYDEGISLVIPIVNEPMSLELAIDNVQALAVNAGKSIGRIVKTWM